MRGEKDYFEHPLPRSASVSVVLQSMAVQVGLLFVCSASLQFIKTIVRDSFTKLSENVFFHSFADSLYEKDNYFRRADVLFKL